MTADEARPRAVTAAYWLWSVAAVLLIANGLFFVLESGIRFYQAAGVLWALAGIGLAFVAGRTRLGDARFRRAGVALSIALVGLLAIFSVLSHALGGLVIMVLLMVAGVLLMRPSAQQWFGRHDVV